MSTNKASSCRNTTSPHDILNFCPTMSSHILPGLDTLHFPLKGQGGDRQNEIQRTLRLRKCKITATAPATKCFHCKTCPHRPAIIISTQSGHTPTNCFCPGPQTGLCMDTILTSRFARRFRFTRLILKQNVREETVERDIQVVRKGVKMGQRTQTEAKAAAPQHSGLPLESSTWPCVLSEVT